MGRIVCAGHVNWDVTLRVDALPEPDGEARIEARTAAGGGSAANTATALAGLGHQPLLLGSIGDDRNATLLEGELTDAGVDCESLQRTPDRETTIKYLVVDQAGEVFVLANDGANEAFEAEDLPTSRLQDASHLHLTSQDPGTALDLVARARRLDVPVSFDPGRRLEARDFAAVMQAVDLLFLNEREATAAREDTLLAREGARTVIKRGDGGATLLAGDRRLEHAGFDVATTDTAGAGDAFAAGFVAAELVGIDEAEALAVANACGAHAVRSLGARASLSWAALERFDLPCSLEGLQSRG